MARHLGTRTDVVAAPLMHDTPDELAQPGGVVRDWKAAVNGASEEPAPQPGVTMPRLVSYPSCARAGCHGRLSCRRDRSTRE
jgi:nitrate reductase / nitrite oxidoreductase, alpha subunit